MQGSLFLFHIKLHLIQFLLDLEQHLFDFRQRFNNGRIVGLLHHIAFQRVFGTFERIAFDLGEVVNGSDNGNVVLGKETVAFFVLAGLEHVELVFPITQRGYGKIEHLRCLPYAVIKFVLVVKGFRQRKAVFIINFHN